jgi:hypothetical protein
MKVNLIEKSPMIEVKLTLTIVLFKWTFTINKMFFILESLYDMRLIEQTLFHK